MPQNPPDPTGIPQSRPRSLQRHLLDGNPKNPEGFSPHFPTFPCPLLLPQRTNSNKLIGSLPPPQEFGGPGISLGWGRIPPHPPCLFLGQNRDVLLFLGFFSSTLCQAHTSHSAGMFHLPTGALSPPRIPQDPPSFGGGSAQNGPGGFGQILGGSVIWGLLGSGLFFWGGVSTTPVRGSRGSLPFLGGGPGGLTHPSFWGLC